MLYFSPEREKSFSPCVKWNLLLSELVDKYTWAYK